MISFAGVHVDGRLLGEAVPRYHRTWRAVAGNACYSEAIEASDTLRDRVRGLLTHLGWTGLFELELIAGPDGTWHAIDFNPRPYGSLARPIADRRRRRPSAAG